MAIKQHILTTADHRPGKYLLNLCSCNLLQTLWLFNSYNQTLAIAVSFFFDAMGGGESKGLQLQIDLLFVLRRFREFECDQTSALLSFCILNQSWSKG